MFVTKYDIYSVYHPAEGGIYLTGRSVIDSEEFCTENGVRDFLKEMFYKEVEYYGIPASSVEIIEKDWGTLYRVSNDEVRIIFADETTKPLYSEPYEDEDYGKCEDYNSWLEVEENSPYQDRFCYKYVPESTKGIHERPAIYC